MLNCRVSADPHDVLERYTDALVMIREWSWTIPHTAGGVLQGVNFDTDLDIAVLSYHSAQGPHRSAVNLRNIEEASWNSAETEFTFRNDDGITVTIVPLN